MPHGKRLSDYERGQIDSKADLGWTQRAIATSINRSVTVVSHFLRDRENYGKKNAGGRPEVLTDAEKRRIVLHASNAATSVMDVKRTCNIEASKTTVWKVMKQSGVLQHKKMQRMPKLTELHKEVRVETAELWLETGLDWSRVVFSDEKKFNLDGPYGYAYYWHDPRKEERIFSKRCFGGGSLMVWGCFGFNGGRLTIISGRIDSVAYTSMLESELLPFGEELGGPTWVFQQDNAKVHDSIHTHQFLQDNGISCIGPLNYRSNFINSSCIHSMFYHNEGTLQARFLVQ